jgi:uncharacterized protein involved in outer membrane biogenesis
MKKILKITAIIFVVLIVLIVVVSLFVKSYLTEERMRALVLETTEKSLNRKASLGGINVSLFRGIVVKDFEIMGKNSKSAFLKTKEFVLTYQILPLLTKKLVIDKLSIEDVEIYVTANPDGTYNFSDMVKKDKSQDQKDEKEKTAGLPIDLNVKDIEIQNAKLGYVDTIGKLKKANVTMNAGLKITGLSKNILSSEGSFDATVAEVLLKDGNKNFKDIKTTVRYKIDLDMTSKQITIHSMNLDIAKIPVNITGTVNYTSSPAYSLVMNVPNCNLSEIKQDVTSAFIPKGMVLGGNISMLLNVDKKPENESPANFNGNVKMNRATCAYKNVNLVLDGTVKLTPEMMSLEGLKLVAGQNRADISGSVRNYKEYPDVNVNIKSPLIALDELFVTTTASAKAQETAKPDDFRKEPEPMNLKLKVNASLDIGKTVYKGVAITDFRSRYELKNNVFDIVYLKGNTLSGAFALKASMNLAQKGTTYNMNADLNEVKIEEIVNAFAPKAKGKIFGILSGKAAVSGSGTVPANLKRNLKGNGEFAIKDGFLKNTELSAGLLAILGLRDMKEIPIDKANSKFTISNGIVNLTTLINSKDMLIDETGSVGMDEKLDLGILVKVSDRLAPKLISQSSIATFLSSEKGWTAIPLRVGGTISKPSYGIDTRVVGRKVKESIQKKVGDELQNIIFKDKSKTSPTEQKKSSNPADRLRELFGK